MQSILDQISHFASSVANERRMASPFSKMHFLKHQSKVKMASLNWPGFPSLLNSFKIHRPVDECDKLAFALGRPMGVVWSERCCNGQLLAVDLTEITGCSPR